MHKPRNPAIEPGDATVKFFFTYCPPDRSKEQKGLVSDKELLEKYRKIALRELALRNKINNKAPDHLPDVTFEEVVRDGKGKKAEVLSIEFEIQIEYHVFTR